MVNYCSYNGDYLVFQYIPKINVTSSEGILKQMLCNSLLCC